MRKLQLILLILGLSLNLNAQDVKKVYDLSGRDLTEQYNSEELQKGVYIIDGKKVTLKADQKNYNQMDACYHKHYQKKTQADEVTVADSEDNVYSIPIKRGYERSYNTKWDSYQMRLNWIGTMMILNRNNFLY